MSPDLADLLPDGVLHLGADLRIISANRAICELLGYRPEALVGADVRDLLEPRSSDGRAVLEYGYHRSAALPSVRRMPEQEITLRAANESSVATYVTGAHQRDDQGRFTGLVLSIRPAGARVHKASSGIEIVSTVSHELRSPLTSVKGYTSLLLSRWERIADDKKKEMLEQVHHDADRVTRLIGELLDISRLQTGRLVLRRQMVDLPALTTSIIGKVTLEYPDLECDLRFSDDFPRVYADPDKLEQVLTNLVENACKYATPKGMVIEGSVHGTDVAVAVTDRGEGIPEEDLPKVFTKFFRRDLGKPTGSGLGLWISRGLVEAHGGELEATSRLGQGTTFRFTLPADAFEELHA
ncbi:MAG: ATP-binding protein [Acidimicrobiia bacterium]